MSMKTQAKMMASYTYVSRELVSKTENIHKELVNKIYNMRASIATVKSPGL